MHHQRMHRPMGSADRRQPHITVEYAIKHMQKPLVEQPCKFWQFCVRSDSVEVPVAHMQAMKATHMQAHMNVVLYASHLMIQPPVANK